MRGLRRIRIRGIEVGLTAVDATLELLCTEGWSPKDEDLGKTFVQRLREAGNYIPADEESLYAPVLTGLFREFYETNAASVAPGRGMRS